MGGARYGRHGGNTTCFEYSTGKERIIFDAGSGLREAGLSFLAGGPCHVHLFISHTHWDHINTIPFFAPLYIRGNQIEIFGPYQGDLTIARAIAQMLGDGRPVLRQGERDGQQDNDREDDPRHGQGPARAGAARGRRSCPPSLGAGGGAPGRGFGDSGGPGRRAVSRRADRRCAGIDRRVTAQAVWPGSQPMIARLRATPQW